MPTSRTPLLDVDFFPQGVQVTLERQELPEMECCDGCGLTHPRAISYRAILVDAPEGEERGEGLIIQMPAEVWILVAAAVNRVALANDPDELIAMAHHAAQGVATSGEGSDETR